MMRFPIRLTLLASVAVLAHGAIAPNPPPVVGPETRFTLGSPITITLTWSGFEPAGLVFHPPDRTTIQARLTDATGSTPFSDFKQCKCTADSTSATFSFDKVSSTGGQVFLEVQSKESGGKDLLTWTDAVNKPKYFGPVTLGRALTVKSSAIDITRSLNDNKTTKVVADLVNGGVDSKSIGFEPSSFPLPNTGLKAEVTKEGITISGKASKVGSDSLKVKVTDPFGGNLEIPVTVAVTESFRLSFDNPRRLVIDQPVTPPIAFTTTLAVKPVEWKLINPSDLAEETINGLAISADGRLSGTPTVAGSTSFFVRAVAADGAVADTRVDITIVFPNLSASYPSSQPALVGMVGQPFSPLAPTITGGSKSYKVTKGNQWPDWIRLNEGTGEISGTPTPGDSAVTQVPLQVEVADASPIEPPASIKLSLSLVVFPALDSKIQFQLDGKAPSPIKPSTSPTKLSVLLDKAYPAIVNATIAASFDYDPSITGLVDGSRLNKEDVLTASGFGGNPVAQSFTFAANSTASTAGSLDLQSFIGAGTYKITITPVSVTGGGVTYPLPGALAPVTLAFDIAKASAVVDSCAYKDDTPTNTRTIMVKGSTSTFELQAVTLDFGSVPSGATVPSGSLSVSTFAAFIKDKDAPTPLGAFNIEIKFSTSNGAITSIGASRITIKNSQPGEGLKACTQQ